ncbi:VWA domain-containing protein [Synechococcus moorigangaii CMS01]|nr:VWA domain-containing protein [Synechococcus moorigangaii CMS01]
MNQEPLQVQITPHREFLPADSPDQKLFIMLKLRPTQEVAQTRPSTSFVFLIDTSGSMYEVVAGDFQPTGITYQQDGKTYDEVSGGVTKLDIVIESLQTLIHSGRLHQTDRISLIQFDTTASTLIGLTPATQISELEDAIAQLKNFSGGTNMGKGIDQSLKLLGNETMTSRRTLIFTDGQTFDEMECRDLAKKFNNNGIPITALGVGDYNEDLLVDLSDQTGGQCLNIVDNTSVAGGTDIAIADLPNIIHKQVEQAQQEVINNLKLNVRTVKGVNLLRVTRVYPDQAEFPLNQEPYFIGTAAANDETIFILELGIDSRSGSRARIAQFGLTYDVPGQNRRGELTPQNVVVQFVTGQGGAVQVDPEVMGYVQQRNISQLVGDAAKVADKDPERADKMIETARRLTVKIGNDDMLASLNNAQDELRKTRKLSAGTRKTVKMGSRGKTVKMGKDINDQFSEEEIRKLSGT